MTVLSALFNSQAVIILISIAFPLIAVEKKIEFLTHYYNILAAIIAFFLTFLASGGEDEITTLRINRTRGERWRQLWWFTNAIIVHFLLGGCFFFTAHFGTIANILSAITGYPADTITPIEYYPHILISTGLYPIIEPSQVETPFFKDRLGGGTTTITPRIVHAINPLSTTFTTLLTCCDLFILFPLAALMYYGVKRSTSWRAPLQILSATLQLTHRILYITTTLSRTTFPIQDFLLADFDFSLTVWIPLIFNTLGVAIPMLLIYQAIVELTALIEVSTSGGVIPIGPKTFVFATTAFERSHAGTTTIPSDIIRTKQLSSSPLQHRYHNQQQPIDDGFPFNDHTRGDDFELSTLHYSGLDDDSPIGGHPIDSFGDDFSLTPKRKSRSKSNKTDQIEHSPRRSTWTKKQSKTLHHDNHPHTEDSDDTESQHSPYVQDIVASVSRSRDIIMSGNKRKSTTRTR